MWKRSNQYTRGPWALPFGPCRSAWEPTWPLTKVSDVAHILSFYTMWVEIEIELIFTLSAVVSEIRVDFENCHIWAWNLAFGQSFRSCTYTLFLPQRVEIDFIFTLRAMVSMIRADFQNGHIWPWTWPGHWPKFQKLHIYTLSTPGGQNWAYFASMDSSFWDTSRFSKLPYLDMKFGHWPKFHKLHKYSLNYPRPKSHSILLYGWPFPRY